MLNTRVSAYWQATRRQQVFKVTDRFFCTIAIDDTFLLLLYKINTNQPMQDPTVITNCRADFSSDQLSWG